MGPKNTTEGKMVVICGWEGNRRYGIITLIIVSQSVVKAAWYIGKGDKHATYTTVSGILHP